MQIRSFTAGILAGLILGGVAWAEHHRAEGKRYFIHGASSYAFPIVSLEEAQPQFDRERERLEEKRQRDPFGPRDTKLELVEQECESRVLDSYTW
jgi:hypothetical protein